MAHHPSLSIAWHFGQAAAKEELWHLNPSCWWKKEPRAPQPWWPHSAPTQERGTARQRRFPAGKIGARVPCAASQQVSETTTSW